MDSKHGKKIHTDVELEFNADDLNQVDITDSHLENEDQNAKNAIRQAKKNAKYLRSPEERKKALRKKILIGCLITFAILAVLLGIPATRWPILNTIGFRGNLVVTVEDTVSKKPISGAMVKSGEMALTTDSYGRATFANLRLGKQTITASKTGYDQVASVLTNGLGTTKKTTAIKVIGIKLDFDLKNWLSGEPVNGATVTYGKSKATSDKSGRASLIVEPTDEPKIVVQIAAPDYITKTLSTDTEAQSREVSLVSAQKNYFISKREGTFSIYSSNLDGSSQQKIIDATGKEDESLLQFSIYRNNQQALLVANRDGKVQNGRVIAGVYVVDLEKSTLKKIDEGSDIQLLEWGDSVIAYTKTDPGLTYDDPALSRIMTYNTANAKLSEIAASNYFSVSVVAQNKLFYLPADAYRTAENRVLTSHNLATGAKQTFLTDKQINYAVRSSYNIIEVQDVLGKSYEVQVSNGVVKSIDRRSQTPLAFALSASAQFAAWSDRRDGQGALLIKNLKDNQESTVVRASGLTNPVRFIGDSLVVVRVATSQETADYVIHIGTGKIAKIVDVSNIGTARYNNL